ncbi:hypothetical protein RMT88_17650 [Bacillus altitudinis]|uniref:hypothetical protein n=1 Tax=Bacillus altitudinis TaxID=293387 RepID=UPI000C156A4B|nr:hypothetical protein [Bacillus altitudinis]ATP92630.1 hypothetical protein CSE15_00960 [Bacillus altitudinis]MDT1121850.1 hypothetical protein [Bacillus altitudinis]
MADLKNIEIMRLEKFLEMEGGYVFDFSNRVFSKFFLETTGKDIYDQQYTFKKFPYNGKFTHL